MHLTANQAIQFRERVRNDPKWFFDTIIKRPLWEKEEEILLAIKDFKEVSVKSCNASGKTYTAGGIVHWYLMGFDEAVVITTAPTGRQVKEVLWREIKAACSGKHLYPEKAMLETKINLQNKCFALGLATDSPDQFQGFHSKNLMVIVDEASGIDEVIFEAIDGLKPSKILLLGNPLRTTGRFANTFKEEGVKKISISAFDTPNLKEDRIVIPGLITKEDVEKFKQRYGEDSDVYRVRALGEFPKAESDVLISIDEVFQAINREVVVNPQFEKKMGVDIARYGDDRSVIVERQMEKVLRKEVIKGADLMSLAGQIIKIAKEDYIKPENINLDVIGMGAGVVDRLREQGWRVNGINVATSSRDSEHYANLRAELYNQIKDWIKKAQLTKDDDWYELTNVKYKFTSKGQMIMESKEDMKKRGIPSPDVADALALTFANQGTVVFSQSSAPILPYYPELGI